MTQENRNMVLAVLLSAIVLIGWTLLSERYFPPVAAPQSVEAPAAQQAPGQSAAQTAGAAPVLRQAVLAKGARVNIETPRLKGTLNLRGARFDDVVLRDYRETLDKDAPAVRLFSPSGAAGAYFAQFGWSGAGAPPVDALWQADGTRLTPQSPVTLRWTNAAGVTFEQRLEVDQDFLFTVTQRVVNGGDAAVSVQPWGLISRLGEGLETNAFNLHVGPLGVLDGTLKDSGLDYESLREDGNQSFTSKGGWLGMTEKYWLAAIVPDQSRDLKANFIAAPPTPAGNVYQVDYLSSAVAVPAGGSAETVQRLFAGAKEVSLLDRYRDEFGIPRFDRAVSWGWFEVIAQPIFYLLSWLFKFTGNFGLAIIGLTVIIRLILFPIANKQFESMAKMRVVAPRMKALQEKYKDDKPRLQQEMMTLYKDEKVNPLAGCLPLVVQIPIFYALYKTLLVSTEMRHQPFVLWIKDLSAPDPLTPLNLFGAIDWQPPAMIAIGVLPLLLGVTMWLQQRLNPTPLDPIQKQVFAIMPWMFMFIMAPFAAGLQLYWTINNIVSIAQQGYMLRKFPMPATPPSEAVVDARPVKPSGKPTPPTRKTSRKSSGARPK